MPRFNSISQPIPFTTESRLADCLLLLLPLLLLAALSGCVATTAQHEIRTEHASPTILTTTK